MNIELMAMDVGTLNTRVGICTCDSESFVTEVDTIGGVGYKVERKDATKAMHKSTVTNMEAMEKIWDFGVNYSKQTFAEIPGVILSTKLQATEKEQRHACEFFFELGYDGCYF
jgi:hypothetical protein